jgi:hypothetical protein
VDPRGFATQNVVKAQLAQTEPCDDAIEPLCQ